MPENDRHEDHDEDDLADLRRAYLESLRGTVAAVIEALAANDRTALRTLAHQTRGAAGMYGYPSLSETAGLLEDAIHEDQRDELILELADEFLGGIKVIASDL